MRIVAKVLSWLFLPLFAPVYALALALFVHAQQPGMSLDKSLYYLLPEAKSTFLVLFVVFSAVFPIITLGYFKLTGVISSMELPNREERMMPAFAVNLAAIGLYMMLISKSDHEAFYSIHALSLGSAITVLACTLITIYWKISLHAAGMGIITGFSFTYFAGMEMQAFWILPLVLVVSGVVISARLFLGAHSLQESVAGYFIGVTSLVATTLLFH